MPTYEYVCNSCGEHLEVVQSFRDEPLTTCPSCGGPLRKVFGSIGVVFKGSGFYKTDSRSDSKSAKSEKTEKAEKSGESAAKSSDSSASDSKSSSGGASTEGSGKSDAGQSGSSEKKPSGKSASAAAS